MYTNSKKIIENQAIEAIILNMDGVITQTTLLHARAWKKMFDSFLLTRQNGTRLLKPLDIKQDFIRYFDGKPRHEGVREFLDSRNIFLPEGNADDNPQRETICGLGNRKNKIFMELIDEEGVDVFQDTINCIKKWRAEGLKTAVISSSKNGAFIIEKAGLNHLFDSLVDGLQISALQLADKPEPDILLRAADELGVKPEHAIVIEDAISGVQAGNRGKFCKVVGVARHVSTERLKENGADLVVNTLSELHINRKTGLPEKSFLPFALEKLKFFQQESLSKHVVVFLDYDGTLAPIVSKPECAFMSEEMKVVVKELASLCKVAIMSGRDRAEVEKMVGLPELVYAGSHGFDISGPGNFRMEHEEGKQYLPDLDKAQQELQQHLSFLKGVQVERKKYEIAVHYQNVAETEIISLLEIVYQISNHTNRLELCTGKKVIELRPSIDWHKGKAVAWLMQALHVDPSFVIPIYMGDDITDEDAFRFLKNSGVGILVGCHGKPTEASYHLEDISQVKQLLYILIQFLKN